MMDSELIKLEPGSLPFSFEESCIAADSIHLDSICANCSIQLPSTDFVAAYTLPTESGRRSVHQGIELIFRCHEVNDSKPNALKFCITCGTIFGRVLNSYMQFIRSTFVGSYIYNLRNGLKVNEAECIDVEIPDEAIDPLLITPDISPWGLDVGSHDTIQQDCHSKSKQSDNQPQLTTQVDAGGPTFVRITLPRISSTQKRAKTRKSDNQHGQGANAKRKKIVGGNAHPTQNLVPRVMRFKAKNVVIDPLQTDPPQTDPLQTDPPQTDPLQDDPLQTEDSNTDKPPQSSLEEETLNQPQTKVCKICCEAILPETTMQDHKKKYHEFRFPCPKCARVFRSSQSRGFHVKNYHNPNVQRKIQRTPCPHEPSILTPAFVTTVTKETEALYQFKCPKCDRIYRLKRTQQRHTRKVHNSPGKKTREKTLPPPDMPPELKSLMQYRVYKCDTPECVETKIEFSTFREWVLHQQETHSINAGYDLSQAKDLVPKFGFIRPCSQCGRKFKYNESMKTHLLTFHLKMRLFPCDICHQMFSSIKSVNFHQKTMHNANKEASDQVFLCTLCGNTYKSQGSLQIHEKTHLGEVKAKVHECDICHQNFNSLRTLKMHTSLNHEERSEIFNCDHCPKSFKLERQLNAHRARHLDRLNPDKICELCGKAYAFKSELKGHLMSVHKVSNEEAQILAKIRPKIFRILPNGERVYPTTQTKPAPMCTICNRTYARREQVYKHYISAHGKTEEEAKEITGFEYKGKDPSKNKYKLYT